MTKKSFVRRPGADGSQALRNYVQIAFLALNAWVGVDFFLFVRQFETGRAGRFERPPGVEGWLPIAGLLNLKVFLVTGDMPRIHPAAMVLLTAFLAMSVLLRRSFCSWLCPVGTFSERLWKLGRQTFGRTRALPRWLDVPLRGLKYLILAFFLFAAITMTAQSIDAFMRTPYGVLADAKMLDFFRNLSLTSAIVLAILILGSLFVKNLWCRYLCPYGALLGLVSMVSPARIRRSLEKCIDCGKCARVCPADLPVDRLVQIRSAECLGCLECVAACPAEGALDFRAFSRIRIPAGLIAVGITAIFLIAVFVAKATGHWQSPVPESFYSEWLPQISSLSH
jgi:polyferredoxin